MKSAQSYLMDFLKSLQPQGIDPLQLEAMSNHLNVSEFPKGEILIAQGDPSNQCFFILKGMVRKYAIDAEGIETTYDFLGEQQTVVASYQEGATQASAYTFSCLEPCIAIVGDLDAIEGDFDAHPEFRLLTRQVMEATLDQVQASLAVYIRMSPEARVKHVMETRPELFTRVPQHQLASFLGMTPESLSRIKRRLMQPEARC